MTNWVNVRFQQKGIFGLPFIARSFDHVFVCFVLEYLSRPVEALHILKGLLKPGGPRPPLPYRRFPAPFFLDRMSLSISFRTISRATTLIAGFSGSRRSMKK